VCVFLKVSYVIFFFFYDTKIDQTNLKICTSKLCQLGQLGTYFRSNINIYKNNFIHFGLYGYFCIIYKNIY
jgi:hypothetical protein